MSGRDDNIQDRERKVYDLKKRNQELEKYKFVLDFRIKELKEQVEPRELHIADIQHHIQVSTLVKLRTLIYNLASLIRTSCSGNFKSKIIKPL